MAQFLAATVAGQLHVRWTTDYEVGVVAFELRRGSPDALGDVVAAGPILATNGIGFATYEIVDPAGPLSGAVTYSLAYTDARGDGSSLGAFSATVAAAFPSPPPVLPTKPQSARRTVAVPIPFATLDGSVFLKLLTTNDGLTVLAASAVADALGQPEPDIRAAFVAGQLRLFNRGTPIAAKAAADGARLYFSAESHKDNYADRNVYFLTAGPAAGPTFLDGGAPPSAAPPSTYLARVAQEQDVLSLPCYVKDPEQDYWYWRQVSTSRFGAVNRTTFSLVLDQVEVSLPAQLTLHLLGITAVPTFTDLQLNGQSLGVDHWNTVGLHAVQVPVPPGVLVEGTNQLLLVASPEIAGQLAVYYVDRFSLEYPRHYAAAADLLECVAAGQSELTFTGFSAAPTVLAVSAAGGFSVVTNCLTEAADDGWRVSLVPAPAASRYVAFVPGAGAPVAALTLGRVLGLASPTNRADYVVLAPAVLADAAQALVDYRSTTGLHARLVSLDSVYDEFGAGFPTPHALQTFLAVAATNWALPPRYAVLVGSGTLDYRDLKGCHDNLTPPLLVATPDYGLMASDSAYGVLDGALQPPVQSGPAVAVGRLKARNPTEVANWVAKLRAYEAAPRTGPRRAVLVADAVGNYSAGDFYSEIKTVQAALTPAYEATTLLRDDLPGAAALRIALLAAWAQGCDFVDYAGHGSVSALGNAGYLVTADAASLAPLDRPPFALFAACSAGAYANPGSLSLTDTLVLSPGGAIAVWAASGLSLDEDARPFNQRLAQALATNPQARLGDLLRQTMVDHIAGDACWKQPYIFNLAGDPGLRLTGPATAGTTLMISQVIRQGNTLKLTWQGGVGPYQVETSTSGGAAAVWTAVGLPVTANEIEVAADQPGAFFRVRGQ